MLILQKWAAGALLLVSFLGFTMADRSANIGDVTIKITKDTLQCDGISCPLATTKYCAITKEKDPKDTLFVIRTNACMMKAGKTPTVRTIKQKVDPMAKISVSIRAEPNGDISYASNVNGISEAKRQKI